MVGTTKPSHKVSGGPLAGSGMTMIIVTHEMGFAREISSRVVFMIEGSIAVDAPPEQFFNAPSDPRLESFLSKVL